MFEKLNLKFKETPNFDLLKGEVVMSYGRSPKPVLTYYKIKDFVYFNSILPDVMPWKDLPPFQVQLAEVIDSSGDYLLPHIDHNISVGVNYYIQTGGSITHFYKLKENGKGFKYPGMEKANIFPLDQVEEISNFIANDNDVYILNVAKIHSVETPKPGVRRFIQWQWINTPFETVKKSLK